MPRLHTLGNVEIRVYPDDAQKHRMPHFHAVSPNEEIVISLPELTVIAGTLRSRARVIVWASVAANLIRLMDVWDLGNPNMKVRRPLS